jgi:hypothetical protein
MTMVSVNQKLKCQLSEIVKDKMINEYIIYSETIEINWKIITVISNS